MLKTGPSCIFQNGFFSPSSARSVRLLSSIHCEKLAEIQEVKLTKGVGPLKLLTRLSRLSLWQVLSTVPASFPWISAAAGCDSRCFPAGLQWGTGLACDISLMGLRIVTDFSVCSVFIFSIGQEGQLPSFLRASWTRNQMSWINFLKCGSSRSWYGGGGDF